MRKRTAKAAARPPLTADDVYTLLATKLTKEPPQPPARTKLVQLCRMSFDAKRPDDLLALDANGYIWCFITPEVSARCNISQMWIRLEETWDMGYFGNDFEKDDEEKAATIFQTGLPEEPA